MQATRLPPQKRVRAANKLPFVKRAQPPRKREGRACLVHLFHL